jgi:hypothetical protein
LHLNLIFPKFLAAADILVCWVEVTLYSVVVIIEATFLIFTLRIDQCSGIALFVLQLGSSVWGFSGRLFGSEIC